MADTQCVTNALMNKQADRKVLKRKAVTLQQIQRTSNRETRTAYSELQVIKHIYECYIIQKLVHLSWSLTCIIAL